MASTNVTDVYYDISATNQFLIAIAFPLQNYDIHTLEADNARQYTSNLIEILWNFKEKNGSSKVNANVLVFYIICQNMHENAKNVTGYPAITTTHFNEVYAIYQPHINALSTGGTTTTADGFTISTGEIDGTLNMLANAFGNSRDKYSLLTSYLAESGIETEVEAIVDNITSTSKYVGMADRAVADMQQYGVTLDSTIAQKEAALRKRINNIQTLRKQSYIQYDTLQRMMYNRTYFIYLIVFAILVMFTGAAQLQLQLPIAAFIFILIFYTVVLILVSSLTAISQSRRRSHNFNTQKFKNIPGTSESSESCKNDILYTEQT